MLNPFNTDSFEIRMQLEDGLIHVSGEFSALTTEDDSIYPRHMTFYPIWFSRSLQRVQWYACVSEEYEAQVA